MNDQDDPVVIRDSPPDLILLQMVTMLQIEKAPDADEQSRTDMLGVGVTLNVKPSRINSGALQPPPSDDGEPSEV